MRPCFVFAKAEGDQPAKLSLLEDIGLWGTQVSDFQASLDAVESDSLNVEINSLGGDVFAGLAMYNILAKSGKIINVSILGIAASAASVIAMAGDTIEMPSNTFMMIHNPWTMAVGNSDALRAEADALDKIGGGLLATYAKKTGLSEDELKPLLAKDTWLSAEEALAKGFATKVTDAVEVKARAAVDLDKAEVPERVRAIFNKPAATPPAPAPAPVAGTSVAKEIHAYATANGMAEHADILAVKCSSLDEAKARISEIGEIKDICAYAKVDAVGYIRNGSTLAQARADIVKAQAEKDQHVDGTRPEPKPPVKKAKSADEIYAERNSRNKGGEGRK